MLCIYMAEYASGWGLQHFAGVCPWDYSQCKYQVIIDILNLYLKEELYD